MVLKEVDLGQNLEDLVLPVELHLVQEVVMLLLKPLHEIVLELFQFQTALVCFPSLTVFSFSLMI